MLASFLHIPVGSHGGRWNKDPQHKDLVEHKVKPSKFRSHLHRLSTHLMLGSWRRDLSHLSHLQPPSKVFWPQEDQEHGPCFIEFVFWLESLLGAIWGKRWTYGSAHREEHSSTDFPGAGGQLRTHRACKAPPETHGDSMMVVLRKRGVDRGWTVTHRSTTSRHSRNQILGFV